MRCIAYRFNPKQKRHSDLKLIAFCCRPFQTIFFKERDMPHDRDAEFTNHVFWLAEALVGHFNDIAQDQSHEPTQKCSEPQELTETWKYETTMVCGLQNQCLDAADIDIHFSFRDARRGCIKQLRQSFNFTSSAAIFIFIVAQRTGQAFCFGCLCV